MESSRPKDREGLERFCGKCGDDDRFWQPKERHKKKEKKKFFALPRSAKEKKKRITTHLHLYRPRGLEKEEKEILAGVGK